jgi:hypothetical protein
MAVLHAGDEFSSRSTCISTVTVIPAGTTIKSPHPGSEPQLQFAGFDQFPFPSAVQTAALTDDDAMSDTNISRSWMDRFMVSGSKLLCMPNKKTTDHLKWLPPFSFFLFKIRANSKTRIYSGILDYPAYF